MGETVSTKSKKIYVASSWKNKYFDGVMDHLSEKFPDYQIYNFRNPPGRTGFSWDEIDTDWQNWKIDDYLDALKHVLSEDGFNSDMTALQECDICVMVLPSGRSANLELGYAVGAKKYTIVYIPEYDAPDLMYLMCDAICYDLNALAVIIEALPDLSLQAEKSLEAEVTSST